MGPPYFLEGVKEVVPLALVVEESERFGLFVLLEKMDNHWSVVKLSLRKECRFRSGEKGFLEAITHNPVNFAQNSRRTFLFIRPGEESPSAFEIM